MLLPIIDSPSGCVSIFCVLLPLPPILDVSETLDADNDSDKELMDPDLKLGIGFPTLVLLFP
jgi:hypothetical protein